MTTTGMTLDWDGQIAILRMDDPATLNAVTLASIETFSDLLDEAAGRARAMILTGAGRAFCSGANIGMGMEGRMEGADYDAGETLDTHINPLMTRLRNLPMPWITAVNGAAAGVGASLALAGDMIIAGESAFFLQAFSRIGLSPDGGSSHLLVRTVGRARATELMMLGERLPAAKALEWGLINRVVPDAELTEAALALAQRLANGAYSQRLIRQLAWSAVDADWETALAEERAAQRTAGRSADHREGVRAFMEKRPTAFTGA
ncbi:enoyl-CoA hydratase-related protein [Brevundimonas guildfordensis]|uniref:Enoyl-CoA hydratase/isomerase family protein n=1 Tax=Brevundimonas guildfordensis TaxID=2762241 RepID=A0ABR8QWB4_9CAUL|nr:enoyl-CoA hydratase-related protein [Brevundimonas guildfordensis]MBD7939788.1 enoyl-CoA hydratase/isomerase family protein [Brevundimonas guildfordensis]